MRTPDQKTIELFKSTPGAISVCEMVAIHNIVAQAPAGGVFCTLGSNAGKDSIAAASGMTGGDYYMVDPCYDLKNERAWSQTVQKDAKNMPWGYVNDPEFNDKVRNRVMQSNPKVNPILMGEASMEALPKLSPLGFSYVFSDSDDHNYDLIRAENSLIIPNLLRGGIICFHDFGNYSAPVQAHNELVASGDFENVHIPWEEIKVFVGNLESGNDSWHCKQTVHPCFVGAVRKK